MQFGDDQPFRLLIHDRDKKVSGAFDEVFRSKGINVIRHKPGLLPEYEAVA
jgi:hypothetical protein